MKKALLTLSFFGTVGVTMAQTNTANGTVTDCNGDPVVGLAVQIFADSLLGAPLPYYNTVYTDSTGYYEDPNVTYNTSVGGTQPFNVYVWYASTGYTYNEFPASAGNTYTNDFFVNCDTTTPPAPDTIYGYTFVSGHVYDCLGNPMIGHPVYVELDSNGTGYMYSNALYTDSMGYYSDSVPRVVPNGTAATVNVSSYNPVWSLGVESGSGISMVAGDSILLDLNMDCPTCSVSFYAYWDSLGTTGNDTIYLFVNYASLNPASTTVSWDYGDSSTGTGISTVHEYASNGVYNVCVTVNNPADSCTATYCDSILFVTRAATRIIKTMPASALGVKKPAAAETFNVYPNPAANMINIQSGAKVSSVRLFDLSGRELMNVQGISAQNNLQLDISHIEKGTYLMSLYNDRNELLHTHTVLKQ